MKITINILLVFCLFSFAFCGHAQAFSTRHHLINIGKNIFKAPLSVLDAAFIKGPRSIKEIYRYEVYGSENPKKNGLFYKKAFAVWSAPPAEAKTIINGVVEGVSAIGEASKNLLSIFASD